MCFTREMCFLNAYGDHRSLFVEFSRLRISRKVYIDQDEYGKWAMNQQKQAHTYSISAVEQILQMTIKIQVCKESNVKRVGLKDE
jgi:hypothetical protein